MQSLNNKNIANANGEAIPLLPIVNLKNTHFASGSALLYIIVLGMVSSYSAPATVDMQLPGSRFRDITADEITWIASLPQVSGVVGNFLSGYVTHKLGRKATLMFISTSYTTGWLAIAYAPSVPIIYLGRLISGFSAGICAVAVPTYIVEIAPTEIRGFLTSGFQVAFSVGVFLVICLGAVLRWSWLAISGAVLTTIAVCLMVIMPESPAWLVQESRIGEAMNGLKFLKGKNADLKKELQEISDNQILFKSDKFSFREFLNPIFYKPLGFSVLLMVFQQVSGVNIVLSYTVEVFGSIGSSVDPHIASVLVAAVQIAGTIVSSILIDKSGRKRLYITSATCMSVSYFVLGVYSYIVKKSEHPVNLHYYGWIPLVSLTVYMFAFSLGLGPIPFVMTPEMAPIRFRSMIVAIGFLMGSLSGFIVTKTFEDGRALLGIYGLLWLYSGLCLLSALFGCFILPETKGLSFREIHRSFSVPTD
ncbi:facilitated trehalose transporter Tret1 [Caerostris darwini]|uniref:Facilitated trehalose transporter Tret1 n=1 Tax=Caerostris darwini TaxID=1538125 RepID=A0AAV4UTH7_9ARAC|nr:facilitated trehalose transporter Tret1 [Caerostris darwini]